MEAMRLFLPKSIPGVCLDRIPAAGGIRLPDRVRPSKPANRGLCSVDQGFWFQRYTCCWNVTSNSSGLGMIDGMSSGEKENPTRVQLRITFAA